MSSSPDLKIVGADVEEAYLGLDTISSAFEQDTECAQDISDALGHPGLATRLAEFSESWRVNREHMATAFKQLSSELRQKLDTFKRLDDEIGGHDNPTPTPSDTEPIPTPPLGSTDQQTLSTITGGSTSQSVSGGDVSASVGSLPSSGTGGTGGDGPSQVSPGLGPVPLPGITEPIVPGTDTAAGADSIVVDTDDGGFRAAATIGAGGAAATAAALMGLYGAWERSQRSRTAGSSDPVESGELDTRASLLQEFERMKLGSGGGAVELVADAKNPDDVLAILRGEDGKTSTLAFADLDGTQTGEAGGSDRLDGEVPSGDSREGQATAPLADAALLDPGAPLSGVVDSTPGGGAGPHRGPDLPTSVGGAAGTTPVHADDVPLQSAPLSHDLPSADIDPSATGQSRHETAASTTAGVGMMGMGMAGAASSGSASSHRERAEHERRLDPHPHQEHKNEGKR